jgi:putative PIN family toxin of toxin-antitoxin system
VRIVLDTNVLIAAFIARGMCSELLEHCVRHHKLVTSEFILNEFREKLTGKFKFTSEEADAAAALLLTRMIVVDPAGLVSPVCRDRDDDNVLATAVAGNCDCIITGDKDLLVLQRFSGIDIVSPRDFLEYEATH